MLGHWVGFGDSFIFSRFLALEKLDSRKEDREGQKRVRGQLGKHPWGCHPVCRTRGAEAPSALLLGVGLRTIRPTFGEIGSE